MFVTPTGSNTVLDPHDGTNTSSPSRPWPRSMIGRHRQDRPVEEDTVGSKSPRSMLARRFTMSPQAGTTTTTLAQESDDDVQRTFDSDSGSDDYVNDPGTRNDALRNARQEVGNEQETETESQPSLTSGRNPSLHFTLDDRAPSVMEPASPPCSHFRSMSFFRSTTSLGLSERPEKWEIDYLDGWEIIDAVEAKQAPVVPEPSTKDRKKLEKIIAKRSKERKEKRNADRISPMSQLDTAPTMPPPTSPISAEVEILAPQLQSQPQTEPRIEQPRPQRQPIVHPVDKKVHISFIDCMPPFPSSGARDLNDDNQAEEEEVAQVAATTRRHNSLSPLRPSSHFTLHDPAVSAMKPTLSPHSHFRSIRSTTSLGLPERPVDSGTESETDTLDGWEIVDSVEAKQAPVTPEPTMKQEIDPVTDNWEVIDSVKVKQALVTPEPIMKDRRKQEIDPVTDNLDGWEVVDSVEAKQAPVASEPTMKDRKKFIAKRSKGRKEKRDVDRISPISEDSLVPGDTALTMPPPTSEVEIPAPAPSLQPQAEPPRPYHTLPQLRPQRQPIEVHIPFIEPMPPRPAPQTPPPPPISPPAMPSRATQPHEHPTLVKSHNGVPQVTAVRYRQTNGPLITQKYRVVNASPLADEISPGTRSEAVFDPIFESMLETPLSPSPADRSGTPGIADTAGLQFTHSTDSFATAPDTAPWEETPMKHYPGRPLPVAPWVETPMKKHYPGRPLPAAPRPHGVDGA